MRQHIVLTRIEIDFDKDSFGTGLCSLKVFNIISGAYTAISTKRPNDNIKERANVNPQVNFTNLLAPICRTML